MDIRKRIFALLALLVSSPCYAVFINGELTTSDALGVDATLGDFYYDLYYVSVDTPMTIEIFMNPQGSFAPYMAYWAGDFTATPDWDTPPPLGSDGIGNIETLYMAFDATPGVNYQVMATTYFYNPTDLGRYHMFIVNPERVESGFSVANAPILNVPEPASWLLLGMGLMGIRLARNKTVTTPKFT